MSNVEIGSKNNGLGFFSILGLLFIFLKLTNYIDWSWWAVLLPIYGPIMIVLFFVIFIAIFK